MHKIDLNSKIIFIGGVQRSGTTLFRNILNSHPEIKIAYENAFYKILHEKYGEKGVSIKGIMQFIDDLIKTKRFIEWNLDIKLLEKKLRNVNRKLNYNEAVEIVVNEFFIRNYNNEKIVGIKNPNAFLHISFIKSIFPNAKIFIIVRDPRSILASEKVKRLRHGSFNSSEYIWKTYRRFSILCRNIDLYSNEIKKIYYEDIIINLKPVTEEICEFLDIEWCESLIYYYKQNESLPYYDKVQHKLSTHKPNKSRIDAYKDTLSNDEITVLEFLLNKEMKQHNYIKLNNSYSFLFCFKLLKVLIFGLKQFFISRLKF